MNSSASASGDASTSGASVSLDAVSDPWELTRALTPRAAVRELVGTDAVSYSTRLPQPTSPWAMYLAQRTGRGRHDYAFRYLGFDFDAKHGHEAGAVLDDVATLVDMLTRHGIAHVVCRSSSSKGMHVWVALSELLSPTVAARIAASAKTLMPSLDTAPLSNARAGCLRPPYAPHRTGSRSEPVAGSLTTLLEPSTTGEQALALLDELTTSQPMTTTAGEARIARRQAPTTAEQTYGVLPIDGDGHPYLPGQRRSLPAAATAALTAPVALLDDASATLGRILCGAARARWQFGDVLAKLEAPGLEHARTLRRGDLRLPRPPAGPTAAREILAADWTRAVRHVAATPTAAATSGDDPTFTQRVSALVDLVDHTQQRADASRGRWTRPGGPADRRVLDQLTAYALAAVSAAVEADIRRLAVDTGIGRSTVARALTRLSDDAWISRTQDAAGIHGAHWTIDPQGSLHRDSETDGTQAATAAPAPATSAHARRSSLRNRLHTRAHLAAQDAFTHGNGLGLAAGNFYARLHEPSRVDLDDWQALRSLLRHGLAVLINRSAQPGSVDPAHVARALGVEGRLERRRRRYMLERETWAWWQAELDWMNTGRSQQNRTARRATSPTLWATRAGDHYPAMPRRAGRVDWRHARAQTDAGILTAATMLQPALAA